MKEAKLKISQLILASEIWDVLPWHSELTISQLSILSTFRFVRQLIPSGNENDLRHLEISSFSSAVRFASQFGNAAKFRHLSTLRYCRVALAPSSHRGEVTTSGKPASTNIWRLPRQWTSFDSNSGKPPITNDRSILSPSISCHSNNVSSLQSTINRFSKAVRCFIAIGKKVSLGQPMIAKVRRLVRCCRPSDKDTRLLQLWMHKERRDDKQTIALSGKHACLVVIYRCLRLIKFPISLGSPSSCGQWEIRSVCKLSNLLIESGNSLMLPLELTSRFLNTSIRQQS